MLLELLQDPNPKVRELTVNVIRQIGPEAKAAIPAVVEQLRNENASVRLPPP